MFSFGINWRDIGLLGLNMLSIVLFFHEISTYLGELQNPLPLELAFSLSLILALLMELRNGFSRFAIAQLTATVLVFLCGAVMADLLRDQYYSFSVMLVSEPYIEKVIGRDYYAALTNSVIGYSGCYAVGLSISRLFLWKRFRRILMSIFISDTDKKFCPCCGGNLNTPRKNSF